MNCAKFLRIIFFMEHLRWLLLIFYPSLYLHGFFKLLNKETGVVEVHFHCRQGKCYNNLTTRVITILLAQLIVQASDFEKPSDHFFVRAPLPIYRMTSSITVSENFFLPNMVNLYIIGKLMRN